MMYRLSKWLTWCISSNAQNSQPVKVWAEKETIIKDKHPVTQSRVLSDA